MPTFTHPFRIGVQVLDSDRLFTNASHQNGVVISKTAQDNAICPPMPSTIPAPWNPELGGTNTLNDYKLYDRWTTLQAPSLPLYNSTTGRWEFGKHDHFSASNQGLVTTYNTNILRFESRFEVHESPWTGVYPYLPDGCFLLFDSLYRYNEIESAIRSSGSEYARYMCGFYQNEEPICVFWIYHLTANDDVFYTGGNSGNDFDPVAPSPPVCVDPAYYLYRGMGFKFGNVIFLSPQFVPKGRFVIEFDIQTKTWVGLIYNDSNQLIYSAAQDLSVNHQMPWGAHHIRTGVLIGRQFEGEGLEWTITGKYTPWISQWNIESVLNGTWQFVDEIAGLNPNHIYQLEISHDTWVSQFYYQVKSNGSWSAPMLMLLSGSQWKTAEHVGIEAIRYYSTAAQRPIEMVSGVLFETTSDDPPPSGNDLVVNVDVRMPLVARCKNLAQFVITRVSGSGICRLVLTSPSGQNMTYQFAHSQLPTTIVMQITERGTWRVRVYDGDGNQLRFDREYIVRAGDARSIEVEYKRRAIGLTACYPIEGIPDNTSQLEDGMFVIESGIDDASWK